MPGQADVGEAGSPAAPSYTFGDTDSAATRLRVLSEVFAESSAAFIRSSAPAGPELALDLGCGPGHTTHLLAATLDAERTVGLDNSASFLETALPSATERVAFVAHDVTTVPFPDRPADVLYARWLLMHLPRPEEILRRWAGELAPGGLLLVQESETIQAAHPAFATYLDVVAAMLAANGNTIYLGPRLESLAEGGPLRLRDSRVWRLDIPADVTARLYSLNVRSWRDQAYVRDNVAPETLDRLERDLAELMTTSDRPGIAWDVRGAVFELAS